MARVPYSDPALQACEIRDRLQRMGSLNVTRMMSHAEGPMLAYSKLGTQLLLRGKLDPVIREAVILRIGQLYVVPFRIAPTSRWLKLRSRKVKIASTCWSFSARC